MMLSACRSSALYVVMTMRSIVLEVSFANAYAYHSYFPDLFAIITWELQYKGCHVLGKKRPYRTSWVQQPSFREHSNLDYSLQRRKRKESFCSKMASRYDFEALRRNRSPPSSESKTTKRTHSTRVCCRFLGVKNPMLSRGGTMLTPESTLSSTIC